MTWIVKGQLSKMNVVMISLRTPHTRTTRKAKVVIGPRSCQKSLQRSQSVEAMMSLGMRRGVVGSSFEVL